MYFQIFRIKEYLLFVIRFNLFGGMILAPFLLTIILLEVNFVQAHADISDESEGGRLYLNKRTDIEDKYNTDT